MFYCFDLDLSESSFEDNLLLRGKLLNDAMQFSVRKKMDEFVSPDGTVDAGRLKEHWFPEIKTDVFISHSHKDVKLAEGLAGWLASFNVSSFIDSAVWGYSDELQRQIDDKYCWLDQSQQIYNYSLVKRSGSFVDIMLSTALTQMIDKAECIFFLNTPASVSSSNVLNRTDSSWIYHEIAMTHLVRRKTLRAYRSIREKAMSRQNESLDDFRFPLDLSHFIKLDVDDLQSWRDNIDPKDEHPLDSLYRSKLPPQRSWIHS